MIFGTSKVRGLKRRYGSGRSTPLAHTMFLLMISEYATILIPASTHRPRAVLPAAA
jgi:hypothetical protein